MHTAQFEPISQIRQCGIMSGDHITPSYYFKLIGVFQTTCTGRQIHSICRLCGQKHENQVDTNKPMILTKELLNSKHCHCYWFNVALQTNCDHLLLQ